MPAQTITGAYVDGSAINRTMVIGKHAGALFVLAFSQMHVGSTGLGQNRIQGFKSADDGVTWATCGNYFRVQDGDAWFDACVDGRGDTAPYFHVITTDTDVKYTYLRFNMAVEDFDSFNHLQDVRTSASRYFIGSNAHGEARAIFFDGGFTDTGSAFTHPIPPFYISIDADGGSAGGNIDIPGIDNPDGLFTPMGIAPAPAAGAHPEGAEGWFYIMAETFYDGAFQRERTVFFDDGGGRFDFTDDTDTRGRTAVRSRLGAPEPAFITLSTAGTPRRYYAEVVSNDGGTLQCSQTQIPLAIIEGTPLTGGQLLIGRFGTMYMFWFQDVDSLWVRLCSGAFHDCSSWSAPIELGEVMPGDLTNSPIFMEGGDNLPGGLGILFSAAIVGDPTDEIFDVRYVFVPVSGADITITGVSGIPSGEAFGKTYGISGEVIECGTLNTDAIPPGCVVPDVTDTRTDQQCQGSVGGYGF